MRLLPNALRFVLTLASGAALLPALATPPKTPVVIALKPALNANGTVQAELEITSDQPLAELALELLVNGQDQPAIAQRQTTLSAQAPPSLDPLRGLTRHVYQLAPRQSTRLQLQIHPQGAGNHQLTVHVRAPQANGDVWGDSAEYFYRVENQQLLEGWVLPDLFGETKAERGAQSPPQLDTEAWAGGRHATVPAPTVTPTAPNAAAANAERGTDGLLWVSGYWYMYNQMDQYIPQRERLVELVSGAEVVIAQAYTDLTGFYQFTPVSNPGSFYVRVYTYTGYNRAGGVDWLQVHNASGTLYRTSTWMQTNVPDGEYYMGIWSTPNGATSEPAYWAFNAIQSTWRELFLIYADGNIYPGSIRAEWYPGSTEPTRYNNGNRIYLDNNDPWGPDVVSHEAGHNVMWNVYQPFWPISDCPSPHYIQRAGGIGCAWTEGWADFVPLYVFNDPNFTLEGGDNVNLESPFGFDSGDLVEGNVAASLWDIIDPANESTHDFYTDPVGPLWRTVYDYTSGFFCAYWNHTADFGVKRSRDNCLHQNTIDQCWSCIEDGFEDDDFCGAARFEAPISTDTKNHCDDVDWTYVDTQPDRIYTWETNHLGYLGDTVVTVYDDACSTQLARNDDKGYGNFPFGSYLSWYSPTAQRVKVRTEQYASGYGPNRSYDLSVTHRCADVSPASLIAPLDGAEACGSSIHFSWQRSSWTRTSRVWLDGQLACTVVDQNECVVHGVPDGPHTWYVSSENSCDGPYNSATASFTSAADPIPDGYPELSLGPTGLISWSSVSHGDIADVVRGSVSTLLATNGDWGASLLDCIANDQPGFSVQFDEVPLPDEAWYFLARPVSCTRPGSYDDASPGLLGSRDAWINSSPVACP